MAKLVNKIGSEIFPIETGTVTSALGSITYVKKGNIITYTVNFNADNTGANRSDLATAPYYNSTMTFVGGAIMRVGDVPVNFGAVMVGTDGNLTAWHMDYGAQVEFIGSVTVILED